MSADGVKVLPQLDAATVKAGEPEDVRAWLDSRRSRTEPWPDGWDGRDKEAFNRALGVDVPRGPAVLNALQVLERMDYKPGDRVLVENFLRIMGERGMWVIENPLTAGVKEDQRG